MNQPSPAPLGRFAVRELPREGAWRNFLLDIPRDGILAERERRLAAMALPVEDPGLPAPVAARRQRLADAALGDACDRAAQAAAAELIARLRLRPEGTPRIETLATPPGDDLRLRIAIPVAPEVTPPDPAALVLERLVADPDAEAHDQGDAWTSLPPGTPAQPGDLLVCDIAATLDSQPNRIPQPRLLGARPGPLTSAAAGSLPETWFFGDNGAGLSAELLAVAEQEDPPHLRLRVHGTAPADGQSYVMFHDSRAIVAEPGSTWSGSLALRLAGTTPIGLRGGKLRIYSQPAEGGRTLQRKDAALFDTTAAAAAQGGFGRVYVSNTLGAPQTGLLLMTVLFDHAAGPVDFTVEFGAPRLVEGLDLGQTAPLPLPRLSGQGQRIPLRAYATPPGLAPLLEGICAGETREITLPLRDGLGDRGLVGRYARLAIRAHAVLRPAPTQIAPRDMTRELASQSDAVLQARLRAALLEAAAEAEMPEPAILAELSAIWPRLVAAAGKPPPPEAARAAALRSLRLRLVVEALARRLGIAEPSTDTPTERRAALEAAVLAAALARATVTERLVTPAELAAAAEAAQHA
ncbi:MAG: hypothetical protein O9325_07460 [Roseomonas sp.]|nr:hypothetical protein [Roseomonas sp.]